MNIKNLYIYGLLLLTAFVFKACDDNDVTLIEPNHRVVYTSEMDFENKIQVDGTITFGDVSSGVKSRLWTFPEGIVDIIESDNDVTSTEANVKTIFSQAGVHNVTLNQIFKGDAYVDEVLRGQELDTTIVVTVLDFVSANVQAFHINEDGSNGAELTIAEGAENEVTASKSVRFTYMVNGEPEEFDWTFDGGDPATFNMPDAEIDVKYKRMGTYDLDFIASRARPFGGDTISVKNLIKVIASTDPVDLEQITDRDGNIALVFSREMDVTTLSKDHFSVTIENGATVLNPTISRASVDLNEGNIVILELENEILYNDDVVKVSYTPGTLMTLDAVAATQFTDEVLKFNTYNMLQDIEYDYSFENSTADNWPYLWWGGEWGMFDLEVNSDNPQDGQNSAYIEYHENGGMIIAHRDINGGNLPVPIEAGQTYEIGVWVYVTEDYKSDPYPLPDRFDSDIRIYPSNWNWEAVPHTFGADFPIGEWVYGSSFVTPTAGGDVNFLIRGYNVGTDKRLKFYMDNLSVSKVNLRP